MNIQIQIIHRESLLTKNDKLLLRICKKWKMETLSNCDYFQIGFVSLMGEMNLHEHDIEGHNNQGSAGRRIFQRGKDENPREHDNKKKRVNWLIQNFDRIA